MDKINRLNKTKTLPAIGVFSAAVLAALTPTGANAVLWIADRLINHYYFQFFALTHSFRIQAYETTRITDKTFVTFVYPGAAV